MSGIEQHQPTFEFGLFELNAHTRELRKSGVRLKLQDQPFEVLLLLLECPGEIVSREEIQRRLWPENTYVDFDNAINSAIRKLREALADNPDNPRFIETVPRRGYRFIAPVSSERPGLVRPQTSRFPAPPQLKRVTPHQTTESEVAGRHRRRTMTLGVITVAGSLLVVTLVFFRKTDTGSSTSVRVAALTSNVGLELQPSISPDGTRVAYAWTKPPQNQPSIYVKLDGPGDPVKISKDLPRVFSPVWSPDGRWIAALQDLGQIGVIVLIPASGGPFRQLARITKAEASDDTCAGSSFPFICGAASFGSELAWSPDGKYLFSSGKTARDSPPGIIRVSVETGELRAITLPSKDLAGDFGPTVSPDGELLAFGRYRSMRTGDLYSIPISARSLLSSNSPKRITLDGGDLRTAAWTADGRELIFSSDRGGQRALWRVRATGGTPSLVTGIGEEALDVAISRKGTTLVYNHGHYTGSLWKIPLSGGRGGEPVRVTATTARDKYSQFSPDGKRITFQSARSGVDEIWVCDADGSNAVQLTNFGRGISGSPRWAPDGRMIAFDSNVAGTFHIYVIPSDGGRPVQVSKGPSTDAIPNWSRDGAWIYFTSWRTGRPEVRKVRADGAADTQVTTDGGSGGFESTDGRYLYFVRGDEDSGELWRMPLGGGNAAKVLSSVEGRMFTIFPKGIYFAAGSPQTELRYLEFSSGSISRIAPLPGMPHADVSPDERWALYPSLAMSDTNLIKVENFR
jgi:Tol biopolymer transport system component/DNA-binding winged helix-turn-helix (wHTH) protein